jgi:hypothetical protein
MAGGAAMSNLTKYPVEMYRDGDCVFFFCYTACTHMTIQVSRTGAAVWWEKSTPPELITALIEFAQWIDEGRME